jgi:hypothetical protein
MSPQIIPLKGRADSGNQAGFCPLRLFAFELRRWGKARALVLPGSSASVMRRRWPSSGIAVRRELARDFCRGKASDPIAHFALDFGRKESVCGDDGHRA